MFKLVLFGIMIFYDSVLIVCQSLLTHWIVPIFQVIRAQAVKVLSRRI